MELYENDEITREQFLRMISVGKAEAKNVLGGDLVTQFTKTEIGKNADIRISSTPVEQVKDEFIEVNEKRRIRRKVVGKNKAKASTKKRRIRTRVSK